MYMTFGTGLERPGKTALALGSALAAALLAGACFNPPAAAVQFACDPAGAAACPAGYECRDDGCCHREGSEGDDGACKLGVGSISAGPTTGVTATGATGTDSGSSGAAGSSGGPEGTGSSGATSDASTSSGSTNSTTGSSGSSTSTGSQTTG